MRKRKSKSLLYELTKSYIAFTLGIILLVLFVLPVGIINATGIFVPDKNGEMDDVQNILVEENYDKFPVADIFDEDCYFEILDESNRVIYHSQGKTGESFTKDELFLMSNVGDYYYAESQEYHNGNGEKEYMVTAEPYQSNQAYYLLDKDLNIIKTSAKIDKTSLTEKEYGILTNSYIKDRYLEKYAFTSVDNQKRTAVFYRDIVDNSGAAKARRTIEMLGIFILMAYSLWLILFVWRLNRKVKQPLILLNNAILSFSTGKKVEAFDYYGPKEFMNIFRSFNAMSSRLKESEDNRCRLEEEKKKMLADISHDLKTPITVIQGYAKAICDGMVPEEKQKQYLTTIYQKAKGLTGLIDTFHQYNEVEHPSYQLDLKTTDICEYIRSYLAEKYSELELADCDLDAQIQEASLYCNIDAFQFRRVLENIIGNAIKYNEKGIVVGVFVTETENYAQITIANNGVEISSEINQTIFEPFVVGDASRNSKEGSGLGLALSKKIVEAHAGSLVLLPIEDGIYKTRFRITLPKIRKN